MEKIDRFWQWFQDHNEQLIALGDLDFKEHTELLNALQYQLSKYCEGLSFELGEPTADGRTLTFSAEGEPSENGKSSSDHLGQKDAYRILIEISLHFSAYLRNTASPCITFPTHQISSQ